MCWRFGRPCRRGHACPGDFLTSPSRWTSPSVRKVVRGGVEVDLTRTEYDLLSVLCRHSGQVLSKQQLLQEVWGGSDYYADNVVEVYLSALRRKLEAPGPRVIHTVRGAGYILRVGA